MRTHVISLASKEQKLMHYCLQVLSADTPSNSSFPSPYTHWTAGSRAGPPLQYRSQQRLAPRAFTYISNTYCIHYVLQVLMLKNWRYVNTRFLPHKHNFAVPDEVLIQCESLPEMFMCWGIWHLQKCFLQHHHIKCWALSKLLF